MIRKILLSFLLICISASVVAKSEGIKTDEDNNSIEICDAFELSAEQCEFLSNYILSKNSLYSMNSEATNKNPFDGYKTNHLHLDQALTKQLGSVTKLGETMV